MKHLPRRRHRHTRILPLLTRFKINHEIQLFHSSRHHIRHPLHHVKQVVNLARATIRILPSRIQILTRPPLLVEAHNDLLARLLLRRDVLGREVVDTILPSPGERVQEPLLGVLDGPVRGAEVAEDTVPREPGSFVVCQGSGFVLLVLGAFYFCKGLRFF